MRLPEDLKDRPFKEWNELVKVAVWAWELARIFHCEKKVVRRRLMTAAGLLCKVNTAARLADGFGCAL
jgi:hypothetical protein